MSSLSISCVSFHPVLPLAAIGTWPPNASIFEIDLENSETRLRRNGLISHEHIELTAPSVYVSFGVTHILYRLHKGTQDSLTGSKTEDDTLLKQAENATRRIVVAVLQNKRVIVYDFASNVMLFRHTPVDEKLVQEGPISLVQFFTPNLYFVCEKETGVNSPDINVVALHRSNAQGLPKIRTKQQTIHHMITHPLTPLLATSHNNFLLKPKDRSNGCVRIFSLFGGRPSLYNIIPTGVGGTAVLAMTFVPVPATTQVHTTYEKGKKETESASYSNVFLAVMKTKRIGVFDVSEPGAPLNVVSLQAEPNHSFLSVMTNNCDPFTLWVATSNAELVPYSMNGADLSTPGTMARVEFHRQRPGCFLPSFEDYSAVSHEVDKVMNDAGVWAERIELSGEKLIVYRLFGKTFRRPCGPMGLTLTSHCTLPYFSAMSGSHVTLGTLSALQTPRAIPTPAASLLFDSSAHSRCQRVVCSTFRTPPHALLEHGESPGFPLPPFVAFANVDSVSSTTVVVSIIATTSGSLPAEGSATMMPPPGSVTACSIQTGGQTTVETIGAVMVDESLFIALKFSVADRMLRLSGGPRLTPWGAIVYVMSPFSLCLTAGAGGMTSSSPHFAFQCQDVVVAQQDVMIKVNNKWRVFRADLKKGLPSSVEQIAPLANPPAELKSRDAGPQQVFTEETTLGRGEQQPPGLTYFVHSPENACTRIAWHIEGTDAPSSTTAVLKWPQPSSFFPAGILMWAYLPQPRDEPDYVAGITSNHFLAVHAITKGAGGEVGCHLLWRMGLKVNIEAISSLLWLGHCVLVGYRDGVMEQYTVLGGGPQRLTTLPVDGLIVGILSDRILCFESNALGVKWKSAKLGTQKAASTTGGAAPGAGVGGGLLRHVSLSVISAIVCGLEANIRVSELLHQGSSLRARLPGMVRFLLSSSDVLHLNSAALNALVRLGFGNVASAVSRMIALRVVATRPLRLFAGEQDGSRWPSTLYDAVTLHAENYNRKSGVTDALPGVKPSIKDVAAHAEGLNWFGSSTTGSISADTSLVPARVMLQILSRFPRALISPTLLESIAQYDADGETGVGRLALLHLLRTAEDNSREDLQRFRKCAEGAPSALQQSIVDRSCHPQNGRPAKRDVVPLVDLPAHEIDTLLRDREDVEVVGKSNFMIMTGPGNSVLLHSVSRPSVTSHWRRSLYTRAFALPGARGEGGGRRGVAEDEDIQSTTGSARTPSITGSTTQREESVDTASEAAATGAMSREQDELRRQYLDSMKAAPKETWSDDEDEARRPQISDALKAGFVLKPAAEAAGSTGVEPGDISPQSVFAPPTILRAPEQSGGAPTRPHSRRITSQAPSGELSIGETMRQAFSSFERHEYDECGTLLSRALRMLTADTTEVAHGNKIRQLVHYKVACRVLLQVRTMEATQDGVLPLMLHLLQLRMAPEHLSLLCERLVRPLLQGRYATTARSVASIWKIAAEGSESRAMQSFEEGIELMPGPHNQLDPVMRSHTLQWTLCYATLAVVSTPNELAHCSYCDAAYAAQYVAQRLSEQQAGLGNVRAPSRHHPSGVGEDEDLQSVTQSAASAPDELKCAYCNVGAFSL